MEIFEEIFQDLCFSIVKNIDELISHRLIIFSVIVFILWYYLFYKPFDLFRDFTEFGYDSVKSTGSDEGKRNAINEVRMRRKLGDLPPVYPNGWFAILESDELLYKKSKDIYIMGMNLVAWRGESGKAYVADAYCPHLGAHLGIGGRVKGDCIECPFHSWKFDTDGNLVDIPYSQNFSSLKDKAKIKIRTTIEQNGFIFLWYHAEDSEPTWYPEEIKEIQSEYWRYRGRSEFRISCHCQEMPENGADVHHLKSVHSEALMEGGSPDKAYLKWGFFRHQWDAKWTPSEEEKHISILTLKHNMCLFDKIPFLHMTVRALQIGPGIVHLHFDTILGKGVLLHCVTPIEPLLQKVTHRFYSAPTFVHPYGKLILLGEAIMIERDISIWNRKTYLNKPMLTKEDALIKSFRRWYSQFYSENSPRYYFNKNDGEKNGSLEF